MECVVGNWIRCWEEKNIAAAKEAVGADIKAHMEEVVSVFLYANRMRRSVLVDIVSATTVYQAAPFLKAWPNSSLASKTRTSSMSSNSASLAHSVSFVIFFVQSRALVDSHHCRFAQTKKLVLVTLSECSLFWSSFIVDSSGK
ncbi:hypothetical protein LR48_Vigan04g078700 [Vigna angularis]|uniref:Uncharacterized protein n=1 Tax=Phaseolus angularis TaxID=3914 RepID=A0A0L9UDI6_PHAAN|nr:hypothetical protein LR48_Vigan04g078700 [Vigna angularis]